MQVAVHAEQQAAASVSMVELTKAERQAKTEAEIAAIQPLFIFEGNALNPEGDIEFTILNNGKVREMFSYLQRCLRPVHFLTAQIF